MVAELIEKIEAEVVTEAKAVDAKIIEWKQKYIDCHAIGTEIRAHLEHAFAALKTLL